MTLDKFSEIVKDFLGFKDNCFADVEIRMQNGKITYLNDGGNIVNPKTGELESRHKRVRLKSPLDKTE